MSTYLRKIGMLLHLRIEKIRAINRRYAKPRLATNTVTSVALFALRLYLVFVVGVLFYKFFSLVA